MHSKFQLALFFGGHCTQLGATLREINVIESNCLSISPHITPKINYKTRGNRQPVNRFWNLFSSKETGHLELTRLNSFILIVLKNSKTERFLLLRDHGHGEQPHFEFQKPLWDSRYVLRILKFTAVLRISLAFQLVQFILLLWKWRKLSLVLFYRAFTNNKAQFSGGY